MINLIFTACLLVICFHQSLFSKENNLSPTVYLKDRIPHNNMRYQSMKLALELMEERNVKTIVETGTARDGFNGFWSNGGSTMIFGHWAQNNDSYLYSVDINPLAIEIAKSCVGENDHVNFVCSDSVSFLENFDQQIDFLYLDSFDFDADNPTPSQEHHLKEIIAAYSKLTPQSVVMVDDCDLPFGGKCSLVIPYLLDRGWRIYYQKYQVILVRE